MSTISKELLFVVLAILITLGTLLIPQTPHISSKTSEEVSFGFPFSFVNVELDASTSSEAKQSVTYTIWNIDTNSMNINYINLLLSLFIIWGAFWGILHLIQHIKWHDVIDVIWNVLFGRI